jgi:DNA-binding NtrC family response regulator
MTTKPVSTRVLIVDDEHIIADTLSVILQISGFDSRAVYSAEEARSMALRWRPDAVIIDVYLGESNGVKLAISLSEDLPSSKVFVMGGDHASMELLEQSKTVGHDFPVLNKPFHPNQLLELLGAPPLPKTHGVSTQSAIKSL